MSPRDPSVDLELAALAEGIAESVRSYVSTVREVATGADQARALPLLLLAVTEASSTGGRLGALADVLPDERFEADCGPDPDVDAVREGLANLLTGLDEYADVVDPLLVPELTTSHISDDLAEISIALLHGLDHYDAGRASEALWWWQFSYLASWGERAAQCTRALLSIISHVRLDADEDVVLEAEADALLIPAAGDPDRA